MYSIYNIIFVYTYYIISKCSVCNSKFFLLSVYYNNVHIRRVLLILDLYSQLLALYLYMAIRVISISLQIVVLGRFVEKYRMRIKNPNIHSLCNLESYP